MGKCYDEGIKVRRELANAKYAYVSFSGGKDSTAMLLRLLELGAQVDRIVFADTGFEFADLHAYIDRIEKHINRKVIRLQPEKGLWEKWFYGKTTRGKHVGKPRGFPFYAYGCWYSREAKIKPLQKAMVDAKVIYVGIAADEAHRCSSDGFVRYPLVEWGWTERDCVDYLRRKGLMNPLYEDYNRLGCYLCPKQSMASLHSLWRTNPTLWSRTRRWDEESRRITEHGMKEKPLADHERLFASGWKPRQRPKYACESCNAVGSAFRIRQAKIQAFVEKRRASNLERSS